MEREKTREPEAAQSNQYEEAIRLRQEWIERQNKGRLLIRGAEQKYEETRQGRLKHYLSMYPKVSDTALDSWNCFIHDIRRQSGRHRHQGGILIYVIEGEGSTEVDGEVLEWRAGDLLLLPIRPKGCIHQHWNKDSSKPCRWVAFRHVAVRDYTANYIEQLVKTPDGEAGSGGLTTSQGKVRTDWKAEVHGDQVSLVTHPRQLEQVNMFDKLIELRDQARAREAKATWLIRGSELPWELNAHGRMQWYLHPCIAYSVVQTNLFYRQEIPVGSRSGVQRHGGDVVFFILRGQGYTELDGVKYNWEAEDVMTLPLRPDGGIYRHVNTGNEPVLLIGIEPNMVHTVGVDRHAGFEELQPCPEYRARPDGGR
jgi:quercetin dioxygenase-like cupin family protein